jgi:hypothetical protein
VPSASSRSGYVENDERLRAKPFARIRTGWTYDARRRASNDFETYTRGRARASWAFREMQIKVVGIEPQ